MFAVANIPVSVCVKFMMKKKLSSALTKDKSKQKNCK